MKTIVTHFENGKKIFETETEFINFVQKVFDENEENGENPPVKRPDEYAFALYYLKQYCDNFSDIKSLPDGGIETETYTLPSFYASAIMNGDYSSLSKEETEKIDTFLKDKGHCLSCSENEFFQHSSDLDKMGGQMLEYTFTIKEPSK